MSKLTNPQREFLAIIAKTGKRRAGPRYRPAVKLVQLGLVERRYGSRLGDSWLEITDAGRAALSSQERPDGQ